jgi:hypothetical protein
MRPPLNKIIYDMSSDEYHGWPDTYSSSQFKDALDDEELFFKKYIEKSIARDQTGALDIGTYFHCGVLEPHKLKDECAVFSKPVRRGASWDVFKKEHDGKVILTPKQKEQAESLIKCVQDSPIAMSYIERGKPEVSTFVELAVLGREIFSGSGSLVLSQEGWVSSELGGSMKKDLAKKAVRLVVKTRADCFGKDFILDLKSTTGNAKSEKKIKDTISYYNYDLSAALYLDIFSLATGRDYRDFIWTFASKDYFNSRSYRASESNIMIGRAKYTKALIRIAEGIKSNWVFNDYLAVVEPNHYEFEHLSQSETDLL